MDSEKIYLELKKKQTIDVNDSLKVMDIADVYCSNYKTEKKVNDIIAYVSSSDEDWDFLNTISVSKIILDKYPNLDIEFLGTSEIILEIKSREKINAVFEVLKITFVSLTLFFGAALGIMYFHEDVNMSKALEHLYFSFTGEKKSNPLLMNIPYSLGLGIGMITFFTKNKSSSKRRRMEPGPMEMELYLYDLDMEDYIMNDIKKEKQGMIK